MFINALFAINNSANKKVRPNMNALNIISDKFLFFQRTFFTR